MKQNKHIVRGVQFCKEWSEQEVILKMKSLFGEKLTHRNFEILESVYTKLVSPTLPPGETFDGMMVYARFRNKIMYVRSNNQMMPQPQPRKNQKREKSHVKIFEESCEDIVEASPTSKEKSAKQDKTFPNSDIHSMMPLEEHWKTNENSLPSSGSVVLSQLRNQVSKHEMPGNSGDNVQEKLF